MLFYDIQYDISRHILVANWIKELSVYQVNYPLNVVSIEFDVNILNKSHMIIKI